MLPSDIQDAGQGIDVVWLGNAGVLITDLETGLLIDPFVSRHSMFRVASGMRLPVRHDLIEVWMSRLSGFPFNAVIVSHSHYDHAMDAPYFAAAARVSLVGTASTSNIGRGAGLPPDLISVVGNGDCIQVGRFRVTFRESLHGPALFGRVPFPGQVEKPIVPPAPVGAYRLGGVFGIVIEHPFGTIVHHGSAGHIDGMYDGCRADTLMLGLAGRADTDSYLAATADKLGAPRIIPIHFDDMFSPVDGPFRFLPRVRFGEFMRVIKKTRPGVLVETMPVGRPVRLARAD